MVRSEIDGRIALGKNGNKRYGKHNGHDQGCESVLEFVHLCVLLYVDFFGGRRVSSSSA